MDLMNICFRFPRVGLLICISCLTISKVPTLIAVLADKTHGSFPEPKHKTKTLTNKYLKINYLKKINIFP